MPKLSLQIEQLVTPLLDHCPGMGIGITQNGETIFAEGFGYANVKQGIKFSSNSKFRCCSITKQFTTMLVQLAVHEGRLTWQDRPADYLPMLSGTATQLTLHDLATNQSGLADYWCLAMLMGAEAESRFRSDDATTILRALNKHDFLAGSRFVYSNTNFLILGRLLSEVYQRPFAELISGHLLSPLGMNDSAISPITSSELDDQTLGYEQHPDQFWEPANVDIEWHSDAGLVSTVDDLLRWAKVFTGEGPSHLCSAALELTRPGSYSDGRSASYRYGIRHKQHRGTDIFIHHGALRGWRSTLLCLPQHKLSVAVLFNHMLDPAPLAFDIAGQIAGWAQPNPKVKNTAKIAGSPVTHYYQSDLGLVVKIVTRNDTARVYCGGREELLNLQPDTAGGPTYRFANDDDTTRLTMASEHGELSYLEDNFILRLSRPDAEPGIDPEGEYSHSDLSSKMLIEQDGDKHLTIRYRGPLGASTPTRLKNIGANLYTYRCARALDHFPPGTFTVKISPDSATIGCWAAPTTTFKKQ